MGPKNPPLHPSPPSPNAPLRVGFCVSGQGRLFRSAVTHAATLGIQPVLLVMENKAAGDLDTFCERNALASHRLPLLPRSEFDLALTGACTASPVDLLVLTFDKLLPPALVRSYPNRIVNVHPALLPAFKGMRALEQAAASGTRFAGATMHVVDEQMDHGPIIAQCIVGSQPDDDASALGARIFPLLQAMFLQVIAWYAEGRVHHHQNGRVHVRDAAYGTFPISPAIELPALLASTGFAEHAS